MDLSAFKRQVAALCVVMTIAMPTAVVAQTGQPEQSPPAQRVDAGEGVPDDYFMSVEHRRALYEQRKKSTGRALLWTAVLPGLGNIYTEQYLLAGLGFSLTGFALLFLGYGLSTKQAQFFYWAAGTAGAAYVFGGVSSAMGVARYNEDLRRGLKVDTASMPTPHIIAWTFEF